MRDGYDVANFELGWQMVAQDLPGNDFGKGFINFSDCFEDQCCCCCNWIACRRMGPMADRFIWEFEVPVIASLGWAALLGKVEEDGGSRM